MCRGKEHTTRQTILWGRGLDMPHPYARISYTDKAVTKAVSDNQRPSNLPHYQRVADYWGTRLERKRSMTRPLVVGGAVW